MPTWVTGFHPLHAGASVRTSPGLAGSNLCLPNSSSELFNGLLAAHYVEDDGTVAVTDPVERQTVIEKVDAGDLSVRAAAYELDLSPLKVRKLLAAHRSGIPDPTLVRQHMEAKLADPENQALYRKRQSSIEPVFGNIKANRGYRRFVRRGLEAVNSEWRQPADPAEPTHLRQSTTRP
jgi:hypothetical protein